MQKITLTFLAIFSIHQIHAQMPAWLYSKTACTLPVATSITSIAADSSGNIFIAGNFRDSAQFGSTVFHPVGTANLFLAKYDSMANFLWMRSASGPNIPPYDLITAICTDSAGNAYITGNFNGQKLIDHDTITSMGTNPDVFAAKFGPAGNLIWVKQGMGGGSDFAYGIGIDGDGNCYLGGTFQQSCGFGNLTLTSVGGSTDIFLVKLDASGNFVSAHSYGGSAIDQLNSLKVNAIGDCFIAGTFASTDFVLGSDTLPYSNTSVDAFFARLDSSGNSVWSQTGYGPSNQEPTSISIGPDGSCFATGVFKGDTMYVDTATLITFGYWDFFTLKFDSTGTLLFAKNQGSATFGTENSNAIITDEEDNFFTAGLVRNPGNFPPLNVSSTAPADIFIAGFDTIGDAQWVMQSGTPSSVLTATAMCRDNHQHLLITGSYEASTTFGNDSLLTPPGYTAGYYIAKLGFINTTGISTIQSSAKHLRIYPNPTTSAIWIQGIDKSSEVRIYGITGNLILHTETLGRIDVQKLPPAVYIVEIDSGGELIRQKFIKQ